MLRLVLAATFAALALPAAAECRFTLHFAYGSAQVERADRVLLSRLRAVFPEGPFVLSAHADGEGTEAQNMAMAEARARAVTAALRGGGNAIIAGEYWHAVPSDVSAPLNRRVELRTPSCDRATFPEARAINGAGVMIGEGRVLLLDPLPFRD